LESISGSNLYNKSNNKINTIVVSKAQVIVKVLDIRLSDHKITVIDVKLYDEDDTIDKVNHILNLKISILISNLYYILLLERSQNSDVK